MPAHSVAAVSARNRSFGTRFFGMLYAIVLVITLGACDEGGSGSGDSSSSGSSGGTVAPAQSIDLPDGVTEATLGWAPSEGRVINYVVYESRNGGDYTFLNSVLTPRVTVTGSPGDRVQISVIATSDLGNPSSASPASPELVFHADDSQSVAAVTSSTNGGGITPTTMSTNADSTMDLADSAPAAPASDTSATDAQMDSQVDLADAAEEPADNDSPDVIDNATRSMLLESNVRFPTTSLSGPATNWLQARVEEQFNAGVTLVGTGDLDHDDLSELVWQDPSGQLIVSKGTALSNTESASDTPTTFEEGIRLRPTERFIALADFTGDATSEWIIEDIATGDVWMIDSASLDMMSAQGEASGNDLVLIGHGDFDANDRHEFLWQRPDGEIHIGHPTDMHALPAIAVPLAETALVLTVDDVDGDGRDDILTIDDQGRLETILLNVDGDDPSASPFGTQVGPDLDTTTLDLVVTLDLDDDGRAEIAWLDDEDELVLWDASAGPQDE